MDIVDYSKIEKVLDKLQKNILDKFYKWVLLIEQYGWLVAKNESKYKDHVLKGKYKGQRAVRLNRSYRVIYRVIKNNEIHIIKVEKVSKHDYR